MAKLDEQLEMSGGEARGRAASSTNEAAKQKLQEQQEQCRQLQRDLADAISRLAPLDDIRILLACGARANGPVTQGLHPIHYAAYQNFVPAVRLLLLRGSDINAMDDNGYTPVHLCAERGYKELLEFLIQQGAQVCFTRNRQQPGSAASGADEPLSLALKRGHRDCAKMLLAAGADPNARYFMGAEINLVSVLEIGCIELLLRYGARPDSRDRAGLTPLMKAARHPQGYATCKLLIEYGADVNDIATERHDYRTVLHHSIFSGNLDLIRLLLASGARYPRLDFDKPSPLDIAIISGRADIVGLLIEFDADVNAGARTTIGQPLHTALTQRIDNKLAIVRLLLEAGADPNAQQTSSRNTGPPLLDYLGAMRSCAHQAVAGAPAGLLAAGADAWCVQAARLHEERQQHQQRQQIVRLLLSFGARVHLRAPSQQWPLGLARQLERIHDELDLDLLQLLIEAAQQIDWLAMSKIVYACLRSANRWRANELFDPSVAQDMTPERLARLLAEPGALQQGISAELVGLVFGHARQPSSVFTLKQLTRISIRNQLASATNARTDEAQASIASQMRGRQLVERIDALPVPKVLTRYLLFQA